MYHFITHKYSRTERTSRKRSTEFMCLLGYELVLITFKQVGIIKNIMSVMSLTYTFVLIIIHLFDLSLFGNLFQCFGISISLFDFLRKDGLSFQQSFRALPTNDMVLHYSLRHP